MMVLEIEYHLNNKMWQDKPKLAYKLLKKELEMALDENRKRREWETKFLGNITTGTSSDFLLLMRILYGES